MPKRRHIDSILRDWPYKPGAVMARHVGGADGRDLVQMRVEMGLLQMEVEGRPDGERPEGLSTYYHYLVSLALEEGDTFVLNDEQCNEIDREFVQFYHRRICWLSLREFRRAVDDADHTLALMDFASMHAPDQQWALSHEQYRPFVMFHRFQASALAELDESDAEAAMEEVDRGLKAFQDLYAEYDAEEQLEEDELVTRLTELKESIREHYEVGSTLVEELADAVATEDYERAARLRDEISRRNPPKEKL